MKRQGNTGIWTFVMMVNTDDGRQFVLARSEWGTNYTFWPEYWEKLPIIE